MNHNLANLNNNLSADDLRWLNRNLLANLDDNLANNLNNNLSADDLRWLNRSLANLNGNPARNGNNVADLNVNPARGNGNPVSLNGNNLVNTNGNPARGNNGDVANLNGNPANPNGNNLANRNGNPASRRGNLARRNDIPANRNRNRNAANMNRNPANRPRNLAINRNNRNLANRNRNSVVANMGHNLSENDRLWLDPGDETHVTPRKKTKVPPKPTKPDDELRLNIYDTGTSVAERCPDGIFNTSDYTLIARIVYDSSFPPPGQVEEVKGFFDKMYVTKMSDMDYQDPKALVDAVSDLIHQSGEESTLQGKTVLGRLLKFLDYASTRGAVLSPALTMQTIEANLQLREPPPPRKTEYRKVDIKKAPLP